VPVRSVDAGVFMPDGVAEVVVFAVNFPDESLVCFLEVSCASVSEFVLCLRCLCLFPSFLFLVACVSCTVDDNKK
jgi:hypothetical protein